MSDVSTLELKSLLEQAAVRDDRRREADVEWRTRLEGVVKTLADEMATFRRRQDRLEQKQESFEAALHGVAEKASSALDATDHLEGRLIGAVGSMASKMSLNVDSKMSQVGARLDAQDRDILHIRKETDKQTPILTSLQLHMAGTESTFHFLKFAVPLIGAALTVLVPALWWLFSTIYAVHH